MQSALYSCQIVIKLYFSKKWSNIKFHENPPIVGPVVPCGQADMVKLAHQLITNRLPNIIKKSVLHASS